MSKYLLSYYFMVGYAMAFTPLSILVVEPIASTSHHIWSTNLVNGLLRKGHHVHYISVHEINVDNKLTQNLTSLVFEDVMTSMSSDYDPSSWRTFNAFKSASFAYEWGNEVCKKVITTRGAKELLKMIKNVKYDVIVQDVSLVFCLFGLWEVAKNTPPVVGYIPFGLAPWYKDYIGVSSYPNIRPYVHARISNPLSLWEKIQNVIFYIADDTMRYYFYMPISQQLAEKYIGRQVKPLYELGKNVSVLLLNTHSALEPGIPLPPNALEIGGLHAQIAKPIDNKKICEFLDGAKNGAIIISLGTNVSWKTLAPDKLKAVIHALSKLKQRVVWKSKEDLPFQLPSNVMRVKWLSQGDVLAHKNVKAIWTHGGLLSMQEAIWQGVPLIGMPFFMDQRPNTEMLVAKGAGIYLDFETLTSQSILDALDKVLYNESYIYNMKQLSNKFRDRPMPPLDLAIWSIEYTARHPQGSLASPIRSQSWMEKNFIDVYAYLLISFVVILLMIYFLLKMLINFYYDYIYITLKAVHKDKNI